MSKRALTDRLKSTAAIFDARLAILKSDKSIALGKIKANARASELAEARIDIANDEDFKAFIASKTTMAPKPDAPSAGEGKRDGTGKGA